MLFLKRMMQEEEGKTVRSNNNVRLITRLLVFVAALALIGADLVVFGQNSNSSTMQNDNTSMQNSNMSGTNMNVGRRRGGRRRAGANANTAAETTENANAAAAPQENTNTTGNMSTGGGRRRRGRRRSNTGIPPGMTSTDLQNAELERTVGRPEDLSGTYTGNLTMAGGFETSGPATLTISGNDVTIESQGTTHKGRITAVTTRGYTGATLYFPDIQDATTKTPLGVSVRARHVGNSLTLTPLPDNRNTMSFTSSGGRMGGSRRAGRRRAAATQTIAPVETTQPAEATPAPRGRRRGRRGGGNANANASTMNGNTGDTTVNMNTTTAPAGNMNTGGRRGGRRRGGNSNTGGNMNMSGNGNTSTPQ